MHMCVQDRTLQPWRLNTRLYTPGPGCVLLVPSAFPLSDARVQAQPPASLDALAEHFYDGPNTVRAPHCPVCPSLLGSGDATTEGSPGITFDSTTLLEWTTLTHTVLPSHAKPSLITNHDSETVPDQSERSGSFELVSPPSISAFNGGGGNDHASIPLRLPEQNFEPSPPLSPPVIFQDRGLVASQ
jgi:hypothetical protein